MKYSLSPREIPKVVAFFSKNVQGVLKSVPLLVNLASKGTFFGTPCVPELEICQTPKS